MSTRMHPVSLSWLPAFLWLVMLLRISEMLPPETSPVDFVELKQETFALNTSTSDLFNQIFWLSVAALVTGVLVLQGPGRFIAALRRLWLLPVFLGFCLLSAVWALHPDISIRRSALLLIGVYSAAGAVVYCRSEEEVLRVTYIAFAITLMGNLASLAFPFSFDYRGLFRGLAGDKNFLGEIAVIGTFVGLIWRTRLTTFLPRVMNAAYILGWLGLLVLSGNKTAASLAIVAPVTAWLLLVATRQTHLRVSMLMMFGAALMICMLLTITIILDMTVTDALGAALPDTSFTGRDEIWGFAIDQWKSRLLLGFGYGSFWGVGLDAPNFQARQEFIHLLTESHNGYLDIALTVGAIGLFLALAFLWQVLLAIDRIHFTDAAFFLFNISFLIFLLLHNITESSIARPLTLPWTFIVVIGFLAARRQMPAASTK